MLGAPFLFTLQELVSLTNRPPSNFETLKNGLLAPREFLGLLLVNFMGAPSDGFYLGRSLSAPIINGREHCLYLGQASLLAGFLAIVRFRDHARALRPGFKAGARGVRLLPRVDCCPVWEQPATDA